MFVLSAKPHHIELVTDRASLASTPMYEDGKGICDTPDLAFVTIRIVDKDGNLCPDADNSISFKISGSSAAFNSCCNGDATSTESFTAPAMKAFHGELVVVIEATTEEGISTLSASSKGLKGSSVGISVYDRVR